MLERISYLILYSYSLNQKSVSTAIFLHMFSVALLKLMQISIIIPSYDTVAEMHQKCIYIYGDKF